MPHIIRSTSLREVVHAIREDPQTLPSRQDSEQARAGRIGIHTSGRTGGYGCIPEEDGAGGTAGGLPAARTGGRVSECVDKRQAAQRKNCSLIHVAEAQISASRDRFSIVMRS